MLAAVEIYNKTVLPYREESFCLLMANAWELLVKARIVQCNQEDIRSIYVRKKNGYFDRTKLTNSPKSLVLNTALSRVSITSNTRTNIETLSEVRNEVAHMGQLHPDLARVIGELGSASVQNFIKLLASWFGMSVDGIYLLPVAFVGQATAVVTRPATKQQKLLQELHRMVASAEQDAHGYAVSLSLQIDLVPSNRGGGAIGRTRDPKAPRVRIDDTQVSSMYPDTYTSLVQKCRNRYADFKQNAKFHVAMKEVKRDANATHTRLLDPEKPQGVGQDRYNADRAFEILDKTYTAIRGAASTF